MKKISFILTLCLLVISCETTEKFKKPEFKKPFSKCPTQSERTLKDIFCRE